MPSCSVLSTPFIQKLVFSPPPWKHVVIMNWIPNVFFPHFRTFYSNWFIYSSNKIGFNYKTFTFSFITARVSLFFAALLAFFFQINVLILLSRKWLSCFGIALNEIILGKQWHLYDVILPMQHHNMGFHCLNRLSVLQNSCLFLVLLIFVFVFNVFVILMLFNVFVKWWGLGRGSSLTLFLLLSSSWVVFVFTHWGSGL